MSRTVAHAQPDELPEILRLYAEAREFMAANGNPDQWGKTGYPQKELLQSDIKAQRLFAVHEAGEVIGAFVLVFGDDSTYRVIENGAWLNAKPYGTLHRLASKTEAHGVGAFVIDYCVKACAKRGADLRADTHAANLPMQRVLESSGFLECGRIYVADGSPRKAYHKII